MQIQLSTGSKEPISENSASERKGTFRDSAIEVTSGVTSEGAPARGLRGGTDGSLLEDSPELFLAAEGGAQLKCADSD